MKRATREELAQFGCEAYRDEFKRRAPPWLCPLEGPGMDAFFLAIAAMIDRRLTEGLILEIIGASRDEKDTK